MYQPRLNAPLMKIAKTVWVDPCDVKVVVQTETGGAVVYLWSWANQECINPNLCIGKEDLLGTINEMCEKVSEAQAQWAK